MYIKENATYDRQRIVSKTGSNGIKELRICNPRMKTDMLKKKKKK